MNNPFGYLLYIGAALCAISITLNEFLSSKFFNGQINEKKQKIAGAVLALANCTGIASILVCLAGL